MAVLKVPVAPACAGGENWMKVMISIIHTAAVHPHEQGLVLEGAHVRDKALGLCLELISTKKEAFWDLARCMAHGTMHPRRHSGISGACIEELLWGFQE
jgi:hypothetical protein